MTKRKGQKDKHYAENDRSSNTNPFENQAWALVFRKGKQVLFHMWHQSCLWFARGWLVWFFLLFILSTITDFNF